VLIDGGFRLLDRASLPTAAVAASVLAAVEELPFCSDPQFVATQPPALEREVYESLGTIGAAVLCLLRRAAARIGGCGVDRHRALGMDPRLEPLFVDQDFEDRYAAAIARPDVILTPTGPMFIEFNVSAGVGGATFVHVLRQVWRHCYGSQPPFLDGDPLEARAGLLTRMCADVGVPPSVAVLARPEDVGTTSATYYRIEVADLRRRGFDAELCDPATFPKRLAERAEGSGLILRRYVPQEWLDRGADVSPFAATLHPGWFPVLPYSSYLLANKLLLAALSEQPDWLSPAEADLVDRHVPWTRVVGHQTVVWRQRTWDLPQLLVEHRREFVLKHATGNSGRAVRLGAHVEPPAWAALVARACADGGWITQELVHGCPAPIRVLDRRSGKHLQVDVPIVTSPYLVDGTLAGCQARFRVGGVPGPISAHERDVQIAAVVGCD
jgi:hypothetical protein